MGLTVAPAWRGCRRRRAIAIFVAPFLLLLATPASACMPDAITFLAGSVRLSAADQHYIAIVAAQFRQAPHGSILRLTAWTGAAGSPDSDLRIARRRNEAVKAAFIRRGIPALAIETRLDMRDGAINGLRYVQMDIVAGRSAGGSGCGG